MHLPGTNCDGAPCPRKLFDELKWGRVDLPADFCRANSAAMCPLLPGFHVNRNNLVGERDLNIQDTAGHVQRRMVDGNGFTHEEAAALLGAHTIGRTRNTFPQAGVVTRNGPWTGTEFTFDNSYWATLQMVDDRLSCASDPDSPACCGEDGRNDANSVGAEGACHGKSPFNGDVFTWWQDTNNELFPWG
eukprot:gene10206-9914_t